MPRELAIGYVPLKNAIASKPVALYRIMNYDGLGSNLSYNNYDEDLTYDSVDYTKAVIGHSGTSQKSDGQVDQVVLSVGNADRGLQALINAYDFARKQVIIRVAFHDNLTAGLVVEDSFYVKGIVADENFVVFNCSSILDLYQVKVPKRIIRRNGCPWIFKDAETCQYAGPESTCDKRFATCVSYGNQINYGAFPSVPLVRSI